MPELCAYKPCKCFVPADELFCGDVCAMLGANLVNEVRVSSGLPLAPDHQVVPRCACGHEGCGDTAVSDGIH